jgi:hypothetical protein
MTPDPGSNATKMISMMKKTVGFGCAAIEGRKEIHVEAGRLRMPGPLDDVRPWEQHDEDDLDEEEDNGVWLRCD